VTIHEGSDTFGFWPHAHDCYLESGGYGSDPSRVWFFNSNGKYGGEIAGSYVGDAANGSDLLTHSDDGAVTTIHRATAGVTAGETRKFSWHDGSPAIPVVLYDDLKLGFFTRSAQTGSELVLARW
jgi:hypothetical protein